MTADPGAAMRSETKHCDVIKLIFEGLAFKRILKSQLAATSSHTRQQRESVCAKDEAKSESQRFTIGKKGDDIMHDDETLT